MGENREEKPGPDARGSPSPRSSAERPEAPPASGGGLMPAALAVTLAAMLGLLYASSALKGLSSAGGAGEPSASAAAPSRASAASAQPLQALLEAARAKPRLSPQAPPSGVSPREGGAQASATEEAYALLSAAETSAAVRALPQGAVPQSPGVAPMPKAYDAARADETARIMRLLLYDFQGNNGDVVEVKVDGAVWYRVALDRKGTIVRVPMPRLRYCEIEVKLVDDHGDGASFGWESLPPEGMTVPPEVWQNIRRHNQMGGQERVKAGFRKLFTNQVRVRAAAR